MTSVLNQPLELPCGARLPNRISKAAMTEGLADSMNRATIRHERLYKRWSEGGSGMLLTGNVQIDRNYLERPGNVAIDGNGGLEELGKFARAATSAGNHVWMQISHAGRQTMKLVNAEPVGPSAVKLKMPGGQFGTPRALTPDEIETLIEKFAQAALTAKETGFTGVQFHSAHGYLLSEFLSPLANQRTDDYGGTLENRARFLLAVIRRGRALVGDDFPIAIKLNSSDFQQGGYTFEDCLEVVRMLNETSLDLLEISGGNYEQPSMMGTDGVLEPVYDSHITERTKAREAYFLNYARAVKEVAQMPVMVTGGFRTLGAMEEAVRAGEADVIGIGRPLCVMPDLANRLLQGSVSEAPRAEDTLRLGPGILGPQSSIALIKTLNFIAAQAYFCEQIRLMGDGTDPDTRMGALRALVRYQRAEMAAAKGLQR